MLDSTQVAVEQRSQLPEDGQRGGVLNRQKFKQALELVHQERGFGVDLLRLRASGEQVGVGARSTVDGGFLSMERGCAIAQPRHRYGYCSCLAKDQACRQDGSSVTCSQHRSPVAIGSRCFRICDTIR